MLTFLRELTFLRNTDKQSLTMRYSMVGTPNLVREEGRGEEDFRKTYISAFIFF
jgi:hypothetical protein